MYQLDRLTVVDAWVRTINTVKAVLQVTLAMQESQQRELLEGISGDWRSRLNLVSTALSN
jgi:hypothetical protein